MSLTHIQFITLATILTIAQTQPCVPLTGIDDDTPHSINSSTLIDFPEKGIYLGIFKGLVSDGGTPLLAYETAIALRIPLFTQTSIYNVLAAFEPHALDVYARTYESNRRRRCIPADDDVAGKQLFSLHRRIALAYIWSTIIIALLPEAEYKISPVMHNWGLDPELCINANPPCDESTPYGLAHAIKLDSVDYASRDGWNADGSLSRAFNRVPYEDHREKPYVPRNSPWDLLLPRRWQSLAENDGKGFLFHQKHVVPHVGFTGRSIMFREEEVCARKVPSPRYDYNLEIKKLLRRSRNLTPKRKAEIVLFDIKPLSIVPLVSKFFTTSGRTRDDFDVRTQTTAFHLAIYESILASWKEKIRHDLVRPPSMLKNKLGKRKVKAYAGPNAGVQWLPADEWQPYIRTMPHAEFPSSTACMCKTFAEAMTANAGTDDFSKLLNSSLSLTFRKGSSTIERDFPRNDITLEFKTFSGVAKVCSSSRLNGGMHFTGAVVAGEKLCEGIGKRASEFMRLLSIGMKPEYVAPFSGEPRREPRCT